MFKRMAFAAAMAFLLCATAVFAADGSFTLELDGEKATGENSAPMMLPGDALVPLRLVFEKQGLEVAWDQAEKKVTAKGAGKDIVLYIGSYDAVVNGQTVRNDTPPRIRNDRTMVSLSFVRQALDARVYINTDNRTVSIYSKSYVEKLDQVKLSYMLNRCTSNTIKTQKGSFDVLVAVYTHKGMDPKLKYDYRIINSPIQEDMAKQLVEGKLTEQEKTQLLERFKSMLTEQFNFVDGLTEGKCKLEGAFAIKGADGVSKNILSWANYDYDSGSIDGKGFRFTPQFDDKLDGVN